MAFVLGSAGPNVVCMILCARSKRPWLDGQRRRNRRLWRRLARAAEAVAGEPSGPASAWECRAAQSRLVRPEEAPEPSWGSCQGGRHFGRAAVRNIGPAKGAVRDTEVGEIHCHLWL